MGRSRRRSWTPIQGAALAEEGFTPELLGALRTIVATSGGLVMTLGRSPKPHGLNVKRSSAVRKSDGILLTLRRQAEASDR